MATEPSSSPHLDIRNLNVRQLSSSPLLFVVFTALVFTLFTWPLPWLISGAPLLQFFILLGESKGYRVLPFLHVWPIFTTLQFFYAVCSTSWLLYWAFTVICYPTIFLVCLFQFEVVGRGVRGGLRKLLRGLHFIDDKIAFFEIPALEIDTDVDGLMVLRGITFSLSTLSFVVHGVEVGIKLSDDIELAIQTEEVRIKLFRKIEVGDCFANIKGGKYEMTFGALSGDTKDSDGDSVFVKETELLKAALRDGDTRRPELVKMTSHFTDGNPPDDSTAKEGLQSIKQMSPESGEARGRYRKMLQFIEKTSVIEEARTYVKKMNKKASDEERTFESTDDNAIRAAICSQIHSKPSVPHPPKMSVKVTTVQNLSPPNVKRFMHRLPMLLRALLNPLSYFHPVHISSITATASGRWIESLLVENIFKSYADQDSEIASLKSQISSWLSDANFAVGLAGIKGLAQVPFLPAYDINCLLAFDDVMAYRATPNVVNLQQVIRLGGADANFIVPTFLLPHHEHLLPPKPTEADEKELEKDIDEADGKPKEIQAQHHLSQAFSDETNVKISVHARLPAVFDQELLDFIAALVKATKVVELEEEPSIMDEEVHGIKEFGSKLKGGLKVGVKKAVVDGVVNERWIAKLVGKITRKLETAKGEAGYSGDIPVRLGIYRTGEVERDGEKLLP